MALTADDLKWMSDKFEETNAHIATVAERSTVLEGQVSEHLDFHKWMNRKVVLAIIAGVPTVMGLFIAALRLYDKVFP